MTVLTIHRTTSVPAVLVPNAIYFVNAPNSTYAEIYLTGNTATAERLINEADVQAMINTAVVGVNNLTVVADIPARDALNLTGDAMVLVLDATADATVDTGGATYAWQSAQTTWIKISETESMDLQLTWTALQGAPASPVADIDDAVSKRHIHANMTQLGKIDQDGNGFLLYDGNLPHVGWDSTDW